MWKTAGSPKTVRVTKKLAEEFAKMDPAPMDRPLSERRLQIYERIMNAGQFRPLEWSKARCEETGGVYRVNGKHTSTLLSGMDKIPELYVTLSEYVCENLDDVARLYATFDSSIGSRNATDINASFVGTMPNLKNIPMQVINPTVGGIAYFSFQDNYSKITAAERAEALLDNEDFALFVHAIVSTNTVNARCLVRVPVVAAMYGTFRKDPDDAQKFWEAVRDETGSTPNCADRKVAKFLSTTSVRQSGTERIGRYKAPSREIFCKILHGWNAWRNDETTKLNYFKKSGIPDIV